MFCSLSTSPADFFSQSVTLPPSIKYTRFPNKPSEYIEVPSLKDLYPKWPITDERSSSQSGLPLSYENISIYRSALLTASTEDLFLRSESSSNALIASCAILKRSPDLSIIENEIQFDFDYFSISNSIIQVL